MMRAANVMLAVTMVALLAACTSRGPQQDLRRSAARIDQLAPAIVAEAEVADRTVRHVGDWEGTSIYIARPADEDLSNEICLLAVSLRVTTDWASSCTDATDDHTLTTGLGVTVRYSAAELGGTWERVGDRIWAK